MIAHTQNSEGLTIALESHGPIRPATKRHFYPWRELESIGYNRQSDFDYCAMVLIVLQLARESRYA